MLQRDIERQTVPWCREHNIAVVVYWALMKGLLAGRLTSLDQLSATDARRNYPMYQGEEWEKNQAFVGKLRAVAEECGRSVADVVVNWTIHQSGITVALCGAKRPQQIAESAAAMTWRLSPDQTAAIDAAITARGQAAAKRLFQ
jgi:aryl-alcohol dehydrogenase-like predicted oxidoreductase